MPPSPSPASAPAIKATPGAAGRTRNPFWWVGYVPVALFLAALAAFVLMVGGPVLVPLLLGFAITFLLEPLTSWFQKRGRSRRTAVGLTLLTAFLALVLILVVLLPSVYHQLGESIRKMPLALRAGAARAQGVLSMARERLSPDLYARLHGYVASFEQDPSAITSRLGGWLSKGLLGLVGVGSTAIGLIIVPFFVYYLLLDFRKLRKILESQIPPRYQDEAALLFKELVEVVRGYVRGRFLIACIMATIYALGLLVLRVPLWAGIGVIAGVIGIIPYLGVTSGLILALSFAALGGAGLGRIIGVLVVFALAQLTEDYVLTPRIIGGKLELHPMLVFIALIIAGDLFGLLGLVLAIPALAVLKVLVQFFDKWYLCSELYLGKDQQERSGLQEHPDSRALTAQ